MPSIRDLGLESSKSYNKHIPLEYLEADKESRIHLLHGLLDSDGTAKGNSGATFVSVSEQLVKDVQSLIWSLGGKATLSTKEAYEELRNAKKVYNRKSYTLYIKFPKGFEYFWLKRKQDVIASQSQDRTVKLAIKDIKYVGHNKCKCITLEDPEGLFITTNYIVTHNSAKSSALIADPLPYFANKNFKGLLIRKTMPELTELIDRCKALYQAAYPGTKWKEQAKLFEFPSGAIMYMGYCENEADIERYQGKEYYWIGIDEIAQYNGPWIIDTLKPSLRGSDDTIPKSIKCTCNPWGAGKEWVKNRWNIEFDHITREGNQETKQELVFDTEIGELHLTRKWFFGHWSDNLALIKKDKNFVANLHAIGDKALRDAMLHGSWEAVVGLAFPEFKESIHVCEPFDIPDGWYKWRSCDWGYSTMGVVLWYASDWDGNTYVYREYTCQNVKADEFARIVLSLERNDEIQDGWIDGSVTAERGGIGVSIMDTMIQEGLYWNEADRSKGSRVLGKQIIHQYLHPIEDAVGGSTSKLKIFGPKNGRETCPELIKELKSLQLDKNNPEDIDKSRKTALPDHAYDALRYGLAAMPDSQIIKPTYNNGALIGAYHSPPPVVIDSRYGC